MTTDDIQYYFILGVSYTLIPKKYTHYVFSFFMALLMSCIMSFVITVFNVGMVEDIIILWLKAWLFAFSVAFPTVVLVSPIVKKWVGVFVSTDK